MLDIAIVGAGDLGGTIAHVLARRSIARVIRLIDEEARVAEGKALDIEQAAPVEGFASRVSGSRDLSHSSGAAVVVIADRVGNSEWEGEDGLMLLKRLSGLIPSGVIVCAGSSQRQLVDRGVRELHISRQRLFGTAPEALAAGARALTALAVDASPRDVALSVLGIPPAHVVIPWEDATLAGFALTRLLDEPARRRLAGRISALWPPGPYALASAAAKTIEALAGRTRSAVSCFVAPDDSTGQRTRTAAFPVRVGTDGIEQVLVPTLSVVDRIALENATML
jgi:malate dehydrogenase